MADGENELSLIKTSCVKSNEMHLEYKNITNTLHTFQHLSSSFLFQPFGEVLPYQIFLEIDKILDQL